MDRRRFFQAGAALAAAGTVDAVPARAATPSKLKLGTQHGDSDDILRVMAAFGLKYICGRLPSAKFDENWTAEALQKKREHVASFGIELEAVPLPMSSAYITK